MNFLKRLTGGKGAKETATGLAKQAGLDPKMIMQKIFAHFCGGQKDAGGKPAMDFSQLMGFISKTGIMNDGKINSGMLSSIFGSVMGGGSADKDDKGDPKGTMNFDEFQKGMTKVAEEKYKDEGIKGDKALSKLEQQIIDDNDVGDWME